MRQQLPADHLQIGRRFADSREHDGVGPLSDFGITGSGECHRASLGRCNCSGTGGGSSGRLTLDSLVWTQVPVLVVNEGQDRMG